MSVIKTTGDKISGSKFFTLSKRPLEFFEKEKLFKIIFTLVCIIMSVVTLVNPFVILIRVINSGYFNFGAKYVSAFIFTWLAVVIACWLGFHMWWKKRKKAAEICSSEFIVLPFFSEILKTLGEWLGILFGIVGFIGGLFALIFLRKYSGAMLSAVLFGLSRSGLLVTILDRIANIFARDTNFIFNYAIILGPVAGVLVIFITRFLAEGLGVFTAIANNTKALSVNRKNKIDKYAKLPDLESTSGTEDIL